MPQNVETVLESLPRNVSDLATQLGVTEYLSPVLAMSHAVFPSADLELERHDDPEIPGESCIVVIVHHAEESVEKLCERNGEWHRRIGVCCPMLYRSNFAMLTRGRTDSPQRSATACRNAEQHVS